MQKLLNLIAKKGFVDQWHEPMSKEAFDKRIAEVSMNLAETEAYQEAYDKIRAEFDQRLEELIRNGTIDCREQRNFTEPITGTRLDGDAEVMLDKFKDLLPTLYEDEENRTRLKKLLIELVEEAVKHANQIASLVMPTV